MEESVFTSRAGRAAYSPEGRSSVFRLLVLFAEDSGVGFSVGVEAAVSPPCHAGLEGGEDDAYDDHAEEKAARVGDGVDDGVFVELASGGLKPEAANPEEEYGHE